MQLLFSLLGCLMSLTTFANSAPLPASTSVRPTLLFVIPHIDSRLLHRLGVDRSSLSDPRELRRNGGVLSSFYDNSIRLDE
jgi:hypothetical protein